MPANKEDLNSCGLLQDEWLQRGDVQDALANLAPEALVGMPAGVVQTHPSHEPDAETQELGHSAACGQAMWN